MKRVNKSLGYPIYFGNTGISALAKLVEKRPGKLILLGDENTIKHCLPELFMLNETLFDGLEFIEVPAGENSKSIATANDIWQSLLESGIDRVGILLNLGGGMITDLGGFAAAAYKRGIRFVNIPTSLLAMVDASVGNKTAINLGHHKNQVGLFAQPEMVLILPQFLTTLPQRELQSGKVEHLKHGLIADNNLLNNTLTSSDLDLDAISQSIAIKASIVKQDPTEKDLRKSLNAGHTIGHAIEALSYEDEQSYLLHGEAIAIGLICELYISLKKGLVSAEEIQPVVAMLQQHCNNYKIEPSAFTSVLTYTKSDKKNNANKLLFSLIGPIGTCNINCPVEEKEILEALAYYNSINH